MSKNTIRGIEDYTGQQKNEQVTTSKRLDNEKSKSKNALDVDSGNLSRDVRGNLVQRVVLSKEVDAELPSDLGTTPSNPVYKNIGGNSWTPIVALRIKSTSPNSKLILNNISGAEEGSRDVAFRIIKNPTLTNASWVDTGTIAEYDISATFTDGKILTQFVERESFVYEAKSIRINSDELGSSDIILIAARALKQNNTAYAVINYEVVA